MDVVSMFIGIVCGVVIMITIYIYAKNIDF